MTPVIPSPRLWREELDSPANAYVRRWMRHFPALRATAIEAWADDLSDATPPTLVLPLDEDQRDLLLDEHWRRARGRPGTDAAGFDGLIDALDALVIDAQALSETGAAFVRTGARAPLDSPTFRAEGRQVDGGTEALEVLLESERVFEDLCLAQECGHAPAVVVRPWLELPPWSELRAFVRGRRVVGLSQRAPAARIPGLAERKAELERRALRRLGELAPSWPLDDLVVDLCEVEGALVVLDLHPLLPWTGAALFDWDADRFDRFEFRTL